MKLVSYLGSKGSFTQINSCVSYLWIFTIGDPGSDLLWCKDMKKYELHD